MPAGKYLYRVLADDEDPQKGISARNPEATNAKVSSHVNGLKKSPYISTTATKKAIRAYYQLAVKRYEKKQKKENNPKKKTFTVVDINLDKLLKDKGDEIEVFDLTTEEGRDKYLGNNQKLKNYAKKYDEVLIKGYIPAEYVRVIDIEAMSDDEFSSEGYLESDYTEDEVEQIIEGASGININK